MSSTLFQFNCFSLLFPSAPVVFAEKHMWRAVFCVLLLVVEQGVSLSVELPERNAAVCASCSAGQHSFTFNAAASLRGQATDYAYLLNPFVWPTADDPRTFSAWINPSTGATV